MITVLFLKYLAKHDAGLSAGKAHYQFADVGELIKINHHQYFFNPLSVIIGKGPTDVQLARTYSSLYVADCREYQCRD